MVTKASWAAPGPCPNAGQLGDFAHRVAVAVYQHHGQPLPLRQGGKRLGQTRLEAVIAGFANVEQCGGRLAPAAAAGLPNPEQVAREVRDVLQPWPVLPGVGQCFRGRVTAILKAVKRGQRAAEPRSGLGHKALEDHLVIAGFARHWRHGRFRAACCVHVTAAPLGLLPT